MDPGSNGSADQDPVPNCDSATIRIRIQQNALIQIRIQQYVWIRIRIGDTGRKRYKKIQNITIASVSFFLHYRFKLKPIGIYNQAFPGPRLAFLLQLQVHLRYSTIGYLYSARGQSATNDPLKENFLKSFRNCNELWASGSATACCSPIQ